ncbi:LacI family DNA-binding transcriptional regulator [Alicyclobacillus sp. SO9]|uniref:LacI family DNA-binding transcriptional regulator n=1 Tax=Alicyclobacillus sp. SO9 TaxID=2665646 RepID=UPI0018E6F5D1|nr:LacI family DNA-binding transcriptional regulator [Alicyclobacillus sp. SO9]QQE79435.1 LacI family DNA-binding transcriptional regulator [Alicyclobacillus sp. SO9]
MKVTIRDVAERAGVSAATVSRVLNRPELVEVETRDKVRQAMEALDFRPNALARGLSGNLTRTIGLVVPGITDFFFNEVYAGIEQATREYGMKVLVFDAEHSRHRALEAFTFLHQHQVDGIIFTSKLVTPDYDAVLERIGIPVALVLTQSTGRVPLPAFKVDDVKAVFDGVSYLVSRGHRSIGMLAAGLDDEMTGRQRHEGYVSAMQHYQLPFDERYVEFGDYRFNDGYTAMQRLLGKQSELKLTAVVCASDEMALGAVRCLYDNGFHVPDDISIMGFDDLSIASMGMPRLTTIRQPFKEIGAKAVEQLMKLIKEPRHSLSGVYYLPHQLVERESVRTITGTLK